MNNAEKIAKAIYDSQQALVAIYSQLEHNSRPWEKLMNFEKDIMIAAITGLINADIIQEGSNLKHIT